MSCNPPSGSAGLLAAALCFLVLVAGCDDPSGVGLSAVDFGETDPRARTVPAEFSLEEVTHGSGFLRPGTDSFTERFIVGRADDPLFGTVEATGYIDFAPGSIHPDYFVSEIDEVFLDLVPTYLYGDTTRTLTIDLHEIASAWDPRDFTTDTTLAVVGGEGRLAVTSFTVAPSDTLVRVYFPDEWVAENDSLLHAFDFADLFHGFRLSARDESGFAVGFSGESRLRASWRVHAQATPDTANFISRSIATGATRDLSTASPPPELIPLQDNTGIGLEMDFRLDTLDSQVISAGFIRIEVDTLLAERHRSPYFVRPVARTLILYGLSEGELPVGVAQAELNEEAEAFIFSSAGLNVVLKEMAFGRSRFDKLAVGFPLSPRTLNVVPFMNHPEAPPRVILLVAPHDF